MKVGAFVLHLARAEARRKNAEALLETCGLDGEIWPAVDGASLSAAELDAVYRPRLFRPWYPFKLRPGEIGCFLSHRQIWAEIVRRDLDAALILEDDVALEWPLFAPARDLALRHIGSLGYIKMRPHAPKGRLQPIDQRCGANIVKAENPGLGATAQLVSRSGAAQLLKHCATFDRPVDTFVQSHWFTGLPPSTVYPSGVVHIDAELAGSTIQRHNRGLIEKLRREIQRGRYRRAVRRFSPANGNRMIAPKP
ncbi:glycosyl transferase family 25 [Pelagivirga sediminicola]|uniref:Glycosyl transferase family 25 n=1 Tax=Pelagivirga sediminicola TaxID=2170575 RepID=A0A2T7G5T8_9RHOB|nr:glycosyltransferase family 25 protein [Pelagivirga sediminicola]PVA09778.1 glycosyl transferase family 25 [Pelagivirga sediminicola]